MSAHRRCHSSRSRMSNPFDLCTSWNRYANVSDADLTSPPTDTVLFVATPITQAETLTDTGTNQTIAGLVTHCLTFRADCPNGCTRLFWWTCLTHTHVEFQWGTMNLYQQMSKHSIIHVYTINLPSYRDSKVVVQSMFHRLDIRENYRRP